MSEYSGYKSEEQRWLFLVRAATEKNPEIFGDMNEQDKKDYDELVKFVEEHHGMEIEIPMGFD